MRRGLGIATLALIGMPLASCVGYLRFRADEPVPEAALAALQPGREQLGECLDALGAPDRVFEYRGDGVALLWTWRDSDDWSIDFNVPLSERASARFELDITDTEQPGCVLWFGPDLVLERWRAGTLGDILPGRVRPVVVE